MIKKFSFFLILFLIFIACNNRPKATSLPISQSKGVHSTEINNDTIQILSLDFNEKNLLLIIGNKITSFYHHPVAYASGILPKSTIVPPRARYSGNKIIQYLKDQNKNHYRFVVGLTSKDICTNANGISDWGIFGLGSLDASGCISSTCRLKKGVSEKKVIERLEKVVLHEIGHNHGLAHCISPYPCFMKAADGKISQVDSEPMDMCVECKRKIKM